MNGLIFDFPCCCQLQDHVLCGFSYEKSYITDFARENSKDSQLKIVDSDPKTDSGDDNHDNDHVDHPSWSQLISFRHDPGQPG